MGSAFVLEEAVEQEFLVSGFQNGAVDAGVEGGDGHAVRFQFVGWGAWRSPRGTLGSHLKGRKPHDALWRKLVCLRFQSVLRPLHSSMKNEHTHGPFQWPVKSTSSVYTAGASRKSACIRNGACDVDGYKFFHTRIPNFGVYEFHTLAAKFHHRLTTVTCSSDT
jgi:hypothetical protein